MPPGKTVTDELFKKREEKLHAELKKLIDEQREIDRELNERMPYDDKIIMVFKYVCKKSQDGCASPVQVTNEMAKRGWLADLDSVIDIERIMRRLRNEEEGRL